MLESYKSAQEHWGGVNKLIDCWLDARRSLIEDYGQLRTKKKFTSKDTAFIQEFCEKLIDYVSTGHFGIYEQLTKEATAFNDNDALALAQEILPEIQNITSLVIEFNDKFDTKKHCDEQLEEFPVALQTLGLIMIDRFELEDRLIKELHEAHVN